MTRTTIGHPKGHPNTDTTNFDTRGSYALVNGLNLYYEIYDTANPLILLHGGVGASEMFGILLTKLAEERLVIAVHLQAHGRCKNRKPERRSERDIV